MKQAKIKRTATPRWQKEWTAMTGKRTENRSPPSNDTRKLRKYAHHEGGSRWFCTNTGAGMVRNVHGTFSHNMLENKGLLHLTILENPGFLENSRSSMHYELTG
jgi:hypothetical protein